MSFNIDLIYGVFGGKEVGEPEETLIESSCPWTDWAICSIDPGQIHQGCSGHQCYA